MDFACKDWLLLFGFLDLMSQHQPLGLRLGTQAWIQQPYPLAKLGFVMEGSKMAGVA